MQVREVINETIPPIAPTDTLKKALKWMQTLKVRHLPVVDGGVLVGLLDEEELVQASLIGKKSVGECSILERYVVEDSHIYEAVSVLAREELTLVPVVGSAHSKQYKGVVLAVEVLYRLSTCLGLIEAGAIIEVEVSEKDYSLAHIARLVEAEGVKLLSVGVQRVVPGVFRVVLKVDASEVRFVTSALERFGYRICGVFLSEDYYRLYKERYESLMRYLNI